MDILDALENMELIAADVSKKVRQISLKNNIGLEKALEDIQEVGAVDLAKARGMASGMEYQDISGKNIRKEVLALIPQNMATRYKIVAFDKVDDKVSVAILDPTNLQAMEVIDFLLRGHGVRYEVYVTDKVGMSDALRQFENIREEVGEALKGATTEIEEEDSMIDFDEGDISRVVEDAPVSKAVGIILRHAVSMDASDIHIDPLDKELRIRYRIDGKLHTTLVLSPKIHSALVARIKILSNLKIDEHRIPQDGRFHSRIKSKEVDFRVSTLPTVHGEKVVMRVLDSAGGAQSLVELGLTGKGLDSVTEGLKKSHGLMLVTGPTGSGKSTTLYSILDILNEPGVNIVTLEDPVEYFLPGVAQSQVNPKANFTFASGLRSILRQDPDIIMVGEIRDEETVELAVHAALTGHKVFSTLHTNDAAGAIPRLVDMGIEKFLLVSSVNVIIGQRLVRKLCSACKEKIAVSSDEKYILEKAWHSIPDEEKKKRKIEGINEITEVYHARGCDKCGKEGYRGRIGIFEVIPISSEMQDMIMKDAKLGDIEKVARKGGFISMLEDGIAKVVSGDTTVEEVLRATQE